MSKVNCEAVGKRRQASLRMARAELLQQDILRKTFFIAEKEHGCYTYSKANDSHIWILYSILSISEILLLHSKQLIRAGFQKLAWKME